MVRRLVEEEEVRSGRDEQREREASTLASRERRHGTGVRLPAREEEAAEERLSLRPRQSGLGGGAIEHGAMRRQLLRVLREVSGDDTVPESSNAFVQLPPAEDRFQERRLARSVRPDE